MLRKLTRYLLPVFISTLSFAQIKAQQSSSISLSDKVEFQTFELEGTIKDMMWCGK